MRRPELVAAIVEMKRRNPRFGYKRIADQIALAFDVMVDKDTVRRVLANQGIGGGFPEPELDDTTQDLASLDDYRWKSCCRGLYQLPIAA